MINQIIEGIAQSIHDCFGDGYEIYTERVEQGLKEPCFSIICIHPAVSQFLGMRYYQTHDFCIHYFPKNGRSECYEVFDHIQDALEFITTPNGDLWNGTDIHSEFADDVLHVFVSYNAFVYKKTEDPPKMEEMEYHAAEKE